MRVYFPCTGLGHQRRGFETFTLECARALGGDARLAISVFAGGAVPEVPVHIVANLARASRGASWLGSITGRDSYFAEQFTFFLAFLPHLVNGRPDVVYFADLNLGNLCWHWRRVSRQRFRLLFCNGVVARVTPQGVQHVGNEATHGQDLVNAEAACGHAGHPEA